MTTYKYTEKEASFMAREKYNKFTKYCCFVGDLDEVWDHAFKDHPHVKDDGKMKNRRLDGTQFVDDVWEEREITITKPDGKYWFVCLEPKSS